MSNPTSRLIIATLIGDLSQLGNAFIIGSGGVTDIPQQDNMVRILRPKSGQIIDAHFTLAIQTATAETNPYFKVSVHKVTSSTDFTRLTPTEAQINACMVKITGGTTPFTNTAGQTITLDAVSIISLIPQSGDADYIEDCFTIGVHFYTSTGLRATPLNSTGYRLNKFFVEMSAIVYG
jgi:hypothetical protein